MKNDTKFDHLRPINVTDDEWSKICSTFISEGIRQEKHFSKEGGTFVGSPSEISNKELKESQDFTDKFYENNQQPIIVRDRNLDHILKKAGIENPRISLMAEGIAFGSLTEAETASGQYVPGWSNARTFDREQTLAELLLLQDSAFIKCHTDPNGASLVKNFENYVIGNGIKVSTASMEVNEVISRFRKINKMNIKDKHIARGFFIEGEYFMIFNPIPKTGDVKVVRSPAREITEVITEKGDRDTIIGYKREYESDKGFKTSYYPDINYFLLRDLKAISPDSRFRNNQLKTSKVIQFIKYGNDDELRGRVPMQPIIRFMKYYEDWVIDRIRLNHERSKVVWVRKIDPSASGSNYIATNPFSIPRGGLILTEVPGLSYSILNAEINADDSKEDGLSILYSIAGGMVFPLFIMTQRVDEQSYATVKGSSNPFVVMIESYQDLLKEHMKDMYRTVIMYAIYNGTLDKTVSIPRYLLDDELIGDVVSKVGEMLKEKASTEDIIKEAKNKLKPTSKNVKINTEDIPIGIIFPSVIKDNVLDQAKVLAIYNSIGIASKATMSSMAGFDWNEEITKLLDEKKLNLGNKQTPGQPNPGDTSIDGNRDETSDNQKDSSRESVMVNINI